MITLQPALKNGRNVWDRINMPESEFEERLARIRLEMEHAGIDVLLLYGRGFGDYADPCYVSNFMIRLPRNTLMVVPLAGSVVIFFEGFVRGLPSLLPTSWVKELKPSNDAAKDCAQYLKDIGLVPGTVGLGGLKERMPHAQFLALGEALSGCRVVDAAHIVRDLRTIKSPRERDQIRRAGGVLNKAFDQLGETVFDSMNEQILEAVLRREARFEQAEDFRMLIMGSHADSNWLRPPENRAIEPGQGIIVYAAAAFERYWAETIKTFAAKGRSFSEIQGEKLAFFTRALAAVRPERDAADVYREIVESAHRSGVDLIDRDGIGGGIGLSLEEAPVINAESADRIEEGMCLTLRLAAEDATFGRVMIGGTFIVGRRGIEPV